MPVNQTQRSDFIKGICALVVLVAFCYFIIKAFREGNVPAPYSQPVYDSLQQVNANIQREADSLKEAVLLKDTRIKELERKDTVWIVKYKDNRAADDRLKVKQSTIRKLVENYSVDSLKNAIENF